LEGWYGRRSDERIEAAWIWDDDGDGSVWASFAFPYIKANARPVHHAGELVCDNVSDDA